MALNSEWLINKDGQRFYPVGNSKSIVRGNTTVDADLSKLEEGLDNLLVKVEDLRISSGQTGTTKNPDAIPRSADLNEYRTAGDFYCNDNSTAATIQNNPVNIAFYLKVRKTAGVIQELTTYKDGNSKTYRRGYYSNTWSSWRSVSYDGHEHSSLLIQSGNEINIAKGYDRSDGDVLFNYKDTSKAILNYYFCNGQGHRTNNRVLANVRVNDVYERNIRLEDKYLKKSDFSNITKSFPLGFGNTRLTQEIFDNTRYPDSYIGSIDFANSKGLPFNYGKVLYIPHANDGYGTQLVIGYDGGYHKGIYFRSAKGFTWNAWEEMLTTSERNHWNEGTILRDANTAFETGKAYYCQWNGCANLPYGTQDDGILIPYMHIKNQYGFQIFMTWNSNSIWWRKIHTGTWGTWMCLGGGDWNGDTSNDVLQPSKYMRWKHYSNNHVIFDASNATTPTGRACDRYNSENNYYSAYCPTLMGWNGHQTYGVGVDRARTAEQIQGFQVRNNGGIPEILVNGVWLPMAGGGGKQYTVVRQGKLRIIANSPEQRFEYSGGSGIIRAITSTSNFRTYSSRFTNYNINQLKMIVDGVLIPNESSTIDMLFMPDTYSSSVTTLLTNVEFKHSVVLEVLNPSHPYSGSSVEYLIQTEK